ncbi:MAG TPA: metallophosphoesterase [Polyangiaceae bacterium]|nr:metallophosphoesterase [Polyangiaceae bacterium]
MAKIGVLHLSDLQIGASGSGWLQAEVREEFERDLRKLHERSGPWHLVVISGDLTQTGGEREFGQLTSMLESFWGYLEGLGSSPALLAVPGNHDFVWGSQSSAVRELMQKWRDDPEVPEHLWETTPDPLRQLWRRGFGNYVKWASRWREAHPLPPWLSVREGPVPGDFAATLEVDGARVVIAGSNSALFDLDGSSPVGKLALDLGHLKGALAPEGATASSASDLGLLLTHHPLPWFRKTIRDGVTGLVKGGGPPVVHLCGSMRSRHAPIHVDGLLVFVCAASLFADAGLADTPWGYNAASIEVDAAGRQLKVWPRIAGRTRPGNGIMVMPDASLTFEEASWSNASRTSDDALAIRLSPDLTAAREAPAPPAAGDEASALHDDAEEANAPAAAQAAPAGLRSAADGASASFAPEEAPPPPGIAPKGVSAPSPVAAPPLRAPSSAAAPPLPAPPPLASPSPEPPPLASPLPAPAWPFDERKAETLGAPPPGAPVPQVRPMPSLRSGVEAAPALESFTGPVPGSVRGVTPGAPDLPAGVSPLSPGTLLGPSHDPISRVAWSPDGTRLAVGTPGGHVGVYDVAHRGQIWGARWPDEPVVDLAWSPDGKTLASSSERQIHFWDTSQGEPSYVIKPRSGGGSYLAWSPDGSRIAIGRHIGGFAVLNASTWEEVYSTFSSSWPSCSLAWSRDMSVLASGTEGRPFLSLFRENADGTWIWVSLKGHHGVVNDLAFRPHSTQVASASSDRTVRVWDVTAEKQVAMLEGHTDAVTSVSFSLDGRLLASKGRDDAVRLWRTDTWEQVAMIEEPASRFLHSGLAFSPTAPVLATLGPSGRGVRLWAIDIDALLRAAPRSATVHSVSAKVVLVGEGNAGKSCLALRLAEDRYEEQSATHGMRFWPLPLERLDPAAEAPPGERREVVLWDMGGQSEYRLVHQLFLRDTAVALMLLEPRRGKAAIDEIEGWDKRFQAQAGGRQPVQKLLVGTKVDDEACPVDRPAIDELVRRLGFKAYLSTSARSERGIDELRRALASAIDWGELGRTSRPELFQRLRKEIGRLREERRVVVMFDQLERAIRENDPASFDPEALRAVVKQLAMQGVVADTRLADGTRALVLEVEQVERYAGSLVVLARENPRGVPAIDLSTLFAPNATLPRIGPEERLRRDQEMVVLDCVIELLLEHGICFRHEGLLVFASLFQPSGADAGAALPHAISLYYDFSGAIDNIYASLVASLAMSRRFGPPRLWEDRAEFSSGAEGVSGVRKVERKGGSARGVAHLDVYFDERTPAEARDLFVGFIEDHLGAHGVEILEHLQMTCACGEVFSESAVRRRIAEGQADIGCQACDRRTPLTLGAREARERSPELAQKLRALRTTVKEGRVKSVTEAKVSLNDAGKGERLSEPIRILHLSDLHVGGDADVASLLQPLGADLRDDEEGLGTERLDYLVVSGDLTNRASPEEFERAREFVSALIREFGLTAERCIVVPGNHDLNWDEEGVYAWKKRRQVDPKGLTPGAYRAVGDEGYYVRDDARYPDRFKNFSRYFYHPVLQQEYPLAAEQQCLPFLAPADGLQFLAMNSAFEIDEHFPARSGIHDGALARGLAEAGRQVRRAEAEGRLAAGAGVLRLAVWHHPVSGNEKIENDAFLGRLQQAGVRACLHGHVHEDRADLLRYLDRGRALYAVGAGSFGAPVRDRPEAVPRLYNLVEIERDRSRLRVHTRCLRKGGGAWEGWAVWPGAGRGQKRTYYEIELA